MMSTATLLMAPPGEPPAVTNVGGHERRVAAIRVNVLRSLGRPAHLYRVAVLPLWDSNFRVNVVIGTDATSLQIPNSYFVLADDRGDILQSTPAIRKEY
jgi:hypothetical protein